MLKLWRNAAVRRALYQVGVIAGLGWLFYAAISNALANLRQRGVSTGLSFLNNEAGISIAETPSIPTDVRWLILIALLLLLYFAVKQASLSFLKLTPSHQRHLNWALTSIALLVAGAIYLNIHWVRYQPSESYYLVLVTGMVNSIRVGIAAGIGAVFLGFALGICQLSTNWLLRNLVRAITETARNVPLLLHVLFWYTTVLNGFPSVRESASIGKIIFFSNRGLFYPTIETMDLAHLGWLVPVGAGLLIAVLARAMTAAIAVLIALAVLFLSVGYAATWQFPILRGFNFAGGAALTPEYTALLVGLIVYYASFIADIVRSGVRAISVGQWEGATALGLKRLTTIRRIIIPQALRIIVPPLSNQMLGLAKDTSIGVAVAFPEFVAISRTVINQTGQALEVMLIVMCFYLFINLMISSAMNLYNIKLRMIER